MSKCNQALIYLASIMICTTSITKLYAGIHKCQTEYGYEFSDVHCTRGLLIEQKTPRLNTYTPGTHTNYELMAGFSDAEINHLKNLDAQFADSQKRARQSLASQKKQSAREQARSILERARKCAKANRELQTIASTKRKGYGAKQSRSLDTREALYSKYKRNYC